MKQFLKTIIVMQFLVSAVLAYHQSDLDRGIELYNGRKYAEAEQVLTKVVQEDGENARAHEYLGLTKLSLAKIDEASAELSRAEELAPESDSVKVGLARVSIQKKQFDSAEESLKKAGDINGNNPDVPLYSGVLNVAKGNHEQAVKDLDAAIALKPDNAYAYYYAGLAYSALKRPDKMVQNFQMFLKLAPDAPEAGRVRSLLRSVP
jgi:tetratricopeptide (TPR) repeat protein